MSKTKTHLIGIFSIDNLNYSLPLECIESIESVSTSKIMANRINLKGHEYDLCDFTLKTNEPLKTRRLCLILSELKNKALLVDDFNNKLIQNWHIQYLPNIMLDENSHINKVCHDYSDNTLILMLNPAKLMINLNRNQHETI